MDTPVLSARSLTRTYKGGFTAVDGLTLDIYPGEFVFIVRDKNGKCWYLGKDDAVTLTAGTVGTGTAYADRNGYSMTLSDQSAELPYEVDGDIIDSLLAA